MRSTDVAIMGAGQAGLSASQVLGSLGIAHVVFDRGRVAERWRSQSWDSLSLLTPNWMNRLPGHAYAGPEPDGFLKAPGIAGFLDDYAHRIAAPLEAGCAVQAVTRHGTEFRLLTSRGTWRARAVIAATGHCETPAVPAFAARLAPRLHQTTPARYRNPASLPAGGVLVVGAAASALQIAEELRAAGREVVLAAGRHTRAPRRYRGQDIWWWMDRAGVLADRAAAERDIERARAQPSFQLVGGVPARDLDLGALRAMGVRIVGRLRGAEGETVALGEDLTESVAGAERPMRSLLARIDARAGRLGATAEPWPRGLAGFGPGPARLDLKAERIASVIWATGYRCDMPWLQVAGLRDARGRIRHEGGVTPVPGLFLLGLSFMRRRGSAFLAGIGADAAEIAALAGGHLGAAPRIAA